MAATLAGGGGGLRTLSRVGAGHKFPAVWVTEPPKARAFALHPSVGRNLDLA